MTLEITNDQQAQAAREKLELLDKLEAVDKFLYKEINTGDVMSRANLQAALAAYEQRKAMQVELSELEMAVLVQSFYNGNEIDLAIKRLAQIGYVKKDRDHESYACDGLHAGRAYLEANKQRKLKWEVHHKYDSDSFKLSCDNKEFADLVAFKLDNHTYEVRPAR